MLDSQTSRTANRSAILAEREQLLPLTAAERMTAPADEKQRVQLLEWRDREVVGTGLTGGNRW